MPGKAPAKAKSKAQYRLMQAAAHGYTDKVPVSVAREFVVATPNPGKLPATLGSIGKRK
jgi:hypothetical protein